METARGEQERQEQLEREHAEQIARANAALAAAQDKSYWLDRWHLDLNALMRRRGTSELRAALRAARAVYRLLYDLRSSLREFDLPGALGRAKRMVDEERAPAAGAPTLRAEEVVQGLEQGGLRPGPGDAWLAIGVRSADVGAALAGAYPDLARHDAVDAQQALQQLNELRRSWQAGGRVVVGADADANVTPSWLLASCTPDWRIALYLDGDPDVYVLERR